MVSIPPGSALGRYRVIEQLGRGGMATVYRCHDPTLDRYVAIKVLPSFHTEDPSFIGRFAQEAQTIASLSHPNILQIFDFGEDKGYTYIVSELILGGDLQDRLKGEPLEITQVLSYMRPLADALDYAHGQGIVHRDLKPANVLLTEDDRPILADFGLARMLESAVRFTQASQALGTPEYMSPEQAMGADADHRSDLYAFAIMIYQMLLGETPFRADTPAATLMAHVHQPLPLPSSLNPDIEPRLEATLLKSLAKEPNDRFQSARDMIQAIEMASGQMPERLEDDDLGATAVLDTEALSAVNPTEAPTAVLGVTPLAAAERTEVLPKETEAVAPAEVAPEKAGLPPKWILAGAGITAAVVVAILAALVFKPGGADQVEGGPAAAIAPPQAAPQTAADQTGGPSAQQAVAPAPQRTPTPEPPPTPTVDPLKVLDQIQELARRAEQNVLAGREITIDRQIETEFRSREDLEKITRGFFRRPELRQQVLEAEDLYKSLGLMDEEQDLEEILLGIQLQQVLALFDDESERVYVLLDASNVGPKAELGMASAYMGGIQQALFDIAKMRDRARAGGSDEFRAVNALVGGDVAQVSRAYAGTVFKTQEELDKLKEPIPDNKLLAAPEVVFKTVLFPQREGANFVSALYGANAWAGVNEAYGNPPISTEQVLHPEKYFAGEEPQRTLIPNIAARLGKGWVQVSTDTMGEFLLRTYLEEHLDPIQAATAAEGWGGDRYSLLTGPEGERVMLMMIAWDSFQDSAEFFDAYKVFMGIKHQGVPSTGNETGRKWVAPDETVFIGNTGPAILLIIGDHEDIVDLSLQQLSEALQPQAP